MKYGVWCVGAFFLITACVQQKTDGGAGHNDKKKITGTHQGKVEDKKPVDTGKPVAVLSLNEDDEVSDNDFKVEIFPTEKEDIFKISIRYGGNTAGDELTMLPKSYYEKIALKKGKDGNECIVGFVDTKGKFNEMKSITASGTYIGIKTLKAYYLSTK